ncbi:MAG: TraR/DksA family transcriptional regulator [Vicinamibacterales bacterium]
MNTNQSDAERLRVEELRRMLEKHRENCLRRLRDMSANGDGKRVHRQTGDMEPSPTLEGESDMDLAVLQIESDTTKGIMQALRQLEQGTYGVCTVCGADISVRRLLAVPFATRCRACEEERESRSAHSR